MPTPARRYAIIEAPSNLGLKPTGVERLAERLITYGLADRLKARHAGRLKVPPYLYQLDPATLTLNAQSIAQWTPRLADLVEQVLNSGEFPIILGGDCSILLGPALALKRRGRYGLFFIDGHADFYQPEANPNGEAASMELAFATGRGPELLSDLESRSPLFRDEDISLFGFRDAGEQADYGCQPLPPNIRAFDLPTIRQQGIEKAAQTAVDHLSRDNLDGYFIHLDADALHDQTMPAVDYRQPDGLTWQELKTTLQIALQTNKPIGLQITIYNPKLDPTGSAGRQLTKSLVDCLT